jgi:hypothetical protein
MIAMRWSWRDLQACPASYIPVIIEVLRRQADKARQPRR